MEKPGDGGTSVPVVAVLYDFCYTSKDKRDISVRKGEKLFLIEKTNKDWWQVVRSTERRSFYVPAQYVQEIRKENPKPTLEFKYDETVEYENLNSLVLRQQQDDLPSLSNVTLSKDVNKPAQDVSKQKPVPKTRTKVSVRKNSYENAEIVKYSKSSLSQGIDNGKGDKRNDKMKFDDKITQDLSLSLPRNSDQLSCIQVGESNALDKTKPSEIRADAGKNRMKNSYNLKVKPSKSFDYHQVSASKPEKKQSVPSVKNEKLKLSQNLSRSLEKLAEEIKFEPKKKERPAVSGKIPSVDHYSRTKPVRMPKDSGEKKPEKKGRTDDASIVLDENRMDTQSRASVFSRLRRSLHHNSSFKSRNHKKLGKSSKEACELSSSWEVGLNKIEEREEKPTVTPGGLQRSRTFMVADRSPMSFRQNNRLFSSRNRLDVAYHSQRQPEEKVTLSTFKPNVDVKPKVQSRMIKDIDIEDVKKKESPGSDGKGNIVFYNEAEVSLEEKSLPVATVEPVVDKSLKSQSSVDSNMTVSECTEMSESDDNGSVEMDAERHATPANQQMNTRRTSLVRSKRVEASKTRPPPTPTAEEQAMRDLGDGWGEYRSRDKRSYYYNKNTGDKSWKPPRKKLIGQEKELDGSRESVYSDISGSVTRSNTSSPLNERCHLSNPSLNRSNASLNSRSTYFDNSSFDRSKSGSVYRSKEESPDDVNRCSFNSSPVTGQSRSSSYSLNKSSRDSLNRFSPVENIPSEEEGFELNDHVYQDGSGDRRKSKPKLKLFNGKRKSEEAGKGSESVINEETKAEAPSISVPIPPGWQERYDDLANQTCYVHSGTKQKWYSSHDSEGRVYFFEENSNESSWALPDYTPEDTRPGTNYSIQRSATESAIAKNESPAKLRHGRNGDGHPGRLSSATRSSKAQSMVIEPHIGFSSKDGSKTNSCPRMAPKIGGEEIRKGKLNYTKLAENGKKLKKNWTQAFALLTEDCLILGKDAKSFQNMKNGFGYNGIIMCLSLKGAVIEKGDKISSKKNAYKISSDNTEILIQADRSSEADEWWRDLKKVILPLPQEPVSVSNSANASSSVDPNSPSKVGRTKSLKVKSKDTGSMEDLSATPEERQNKIKARLKKFFIRRPTVDSLKKKGIYKDEPVFGCSLDQITKGRNPRVPAFVEKCIECLESKDENMKADGLYRASGNLSQVQKIRLEVDQNNLDIMKDEEDVHVLTGSLKLFFRELKEPLIPFEQLKTAIKAAGSDHSKKDKMKDFQKIVKSLPGPNYDTLKFLLQHLLRVKEYDEFNRMNIGNLAIVFGPTLMWPPGTDYANMALDLMQQNVVIECLLNEFHEIFT